MTAVLSCLAAAYIIVSALSVLSLQPHQEPRFLTPLLVPSIVLVANSSYMHRLRRTFWVVWIITNIVLSGLFGVFHQGGVVPSLFHVHDRIAVSGKNGDVNVVYWKTYMPPRHLLGIPQADVHSGHINLTDLSGASAAETARALHAISTSARASTDILYLVTPPHAKTGLPSPISGCLALERLVFPHLDLDHLGESVEAGWPNGLGLGVWVANPRCISTQVLEMH
ncbi:glycosyltransferase family 22 protein [Plicaturopsis crispa FD-325 SS-3]|nr:glycosyltransferase family 22 protein [Plicaturopsis crispa FD-325 SS-3]